MENTSDSAGTEKPHISRVWILGYSCVALLVLAKASIPESVLDLGVLAFLFVIAILAARLEIESGKLGFSGEFLPILSACLIVPHVGPVVAVSAAFSTYKSWELRLINTATIVVVTGVGSYVVMQFPASRGFLDLVIKVFVSGLVFLLCNVVLTLAVAKSQLRMSLKDALPVAVASVVATAIFNLPLVAGIVWAYFRFSFEVLPLIFIPLILVQYFHGLYRTKVEQTEELVVAATTLARTNIQFASAMVRALDARDAYTAGHSAAVAVYCRDIAREIGFDDKGARLAHLAGLLHDIGKIGVPGSVLNKTDRLTEEEFELMKDHARIGAEILAEVDSYSEISMLVRHHHERIDGRGYPDKIAGDVIPEISRMISVADTYSAMTTDRPYRKGLDPKIAVDEMIKGAGTQLDTTYVEAFVRILRRESEEYRRGKLTSFDVEVAKHETMGEFEEHVIEKLDDTVERDKAA